MVNDHISRISLSSRPLSQFNVVVVWLGLPDVQACLKNAKRQKKEKEKKLLAAKSSASQASSRRAEILGPLTKTTNKSSTERRSKAACVIAGNLDLKACWEMNECGRGRV